MRRRALGAVLGAAVADAAAMGVQGVLDLSMLDALAAERGRVEQARRARPRARAPAPRRAPGSCCAPGAAGRARACCGG